LLRIKINLLLSFFLPREEESFIEDSPAFSASFQAAKAVAAIAAAAAAAAAAVAVALP